MALELPTFLYICRLKLVFENMRSIKYLIVALLSVVAFASCSKDKSASLVLERTALYFASWEDSTQSISYVATNAVKVAVGSCSIGWEADVNPVTCTVDVTPVGTKEEGMTNDDLSKEGSVVVNVLNKEGESTSYYINVYIADTEAIDTAGAANCYIVTKPSTSYTFDAMHLPNGAELATANVKLLWQSNYDVIKNVNLVDGKAQFYVLPWEEDNSKVLDTNAVIAAYNSNGEVIWSWHIWIVDENPLLATDTYSNGKTFMRKNLGAFTNANGSKDEQKILDSYGMYYQWGRKDPFPRPLYFDATGAYDEDRYNENSTYIKEVFAECTAKNGTLEYVTKHPMHFITNAACIEEGGDGIGDWLWKGYGDDNLWGDNAKSIYDPCPYGWRVPSADDMSVLYLADAEDNTPLDDARKQYGWHLSDGTNKYFYPACGRRRYTDGLVENMNSKEGVYPSQPQPWEGYYWTSSTSADGKAVALYFDLTTTRTINKFFPSHSARRANGFQVRCVKE